MSFKLLLLPPNLDPSWPDKIRHAVPGVDVKAFADPQDAVDDIADADAAYGTVPPELLARATKLRWNLRRPSRARRRLVLRRAGQERRRRHQHARQLQRAPRRPRRCVPLAFARRFDHYLPQKEWRRDPEMIDLPEKTVLIVGVGGALAAEHRSCAPRWECAC